MKGKKKRGQKTFAEDRHLQIRPQIISNKEFALPGQTDEQKHTEPLFTQSTEETLKEINPVNKIKLPGFDFSKRSHQAAFWMLLNTVVYKQPGNSADLFN